MSRLRTKLNESVALTNLSDQLLNITNCRANIEHLEAKFIDHEGELTAFEQKLTQEIAGIKGRSQLSNFGCELIIISPPSTTPTTTTGANESTAAPDNDQTMGDHSSPTLFELSFAPLVELGLTAHKASLQCSCVVRQSSSPPQGNNATDADDEESRGRVQLLSHHGFSKAVDEAVARFHSHHNMKRLFFLCLRDLIHPCNSK